MSLEERIVIERDGTVVAYSGKVEYGQGIRTGFVHIVSEELRIEPGRVRVVLGETDRVPWDMGTFGSMSTAVDGAELRKAAAYARERLLERARVRFDSGLTPLELRNGVIRAPDGREATYAELTEHEPLRGDIPDVVPVASGGDARSEALQRLEAADIVTGHRRYPADVRLAGLLRGAVLRAPAGKGALLSLDERDAYDMPGVVCVVRDGDFAGVVAERDEQARAAVEVLRARWHGPQQIAMPSIERKLRDDGGVGNALAQAAQTHEASYHVPHVAHAALAPSAAVADVSDERIDLYVATQRPFGLKDEIAQALHVAPEIVHVHPQAMGGMFGRGGMNDAPLEAALLSRAARRPVLLQWSRPEEFRMSPARPALDATIRAGLDDTGYIVAWQGTSRTNPFTYGAATDMRVLEMTSGRNAVPAYAIQRMSVTLHVEPASIRTGAFRSLAAAPNIFAIESFMDELAELSGQDPMEFRLRHTQDPRMTRVLEMARDKSRWAERARAGRALGVACAIYNGTYVAQVVQIRPDLRVWCAVDAGRIVWPDGARNQIEGGIQQALSCALLEELRVTDGAIATATWHEYPIATCLDAPVEIDVAFADGAALASTGIGEPGFVPTAAALANAIFAATKQRLRQLPLRTSST